MAIQIEVTRGRYLRHLREAQGVGVRDATDRMNALLPSTEQVSHSWLFQTEKDNPRMKMSVLKALALHRVLGADPLLMGLPVDDFAALKLLTEDVSDLPARRVNRPRGQPKLRSRCIPDPCSARPTPPLLCAPFNAAQSWGGWHAYR